MATSASRGIFALSRDRRLPSPLTKISRHGTPIGASNFVIFVYAIIVVLVITRRSFSCLGYAGVVSMFSWMSTFGGFAIACIYLLISIGALRVYDRPIRVPALRGLLGWWCCHCSGNLRRDIQSHEANRLRPVHRVGCSRDRTRRCWSNPKTTSGLADSLGCQKLNRDH